MGIFKKFKEAVAGTEAGSIEHARMARGVIMGAQVTGTSITVGGVEQRVCLFDLEVTLDDTAPYRATARQRLAVWQIAQIQAGGEVAVCVDPGDLQRVAIDWDAPVPSVRLAASAGNGSAAEVLANGMPCRVIIQQFQPLNMTNAAGLPLYAFELTVVPEGAAPYMCKVGNPVPTEALVHMFPGSQLPAKVMAHEPNGVVIDWAAAAMPVG